MKKNRIIFLWSALAILIMTSACQNPLQSGRHITGTTKVIVNNSLQQEAESWYSMSGVQTEACAEGGLDVGYIDAGDWMVYPITITTTGNFRISYRVASPQSGIFLTADLNGGTTILGNVDIPNTGSWQNWTTVTQTVSLSAGTYNFGLNGGSGGFNLNWIRFESLSGEITYEAENYSQMSGIITEACPDGTLNVGSIDSGDWMVYPITIENAGSYNIQLRVSSIYNGVALVIDLNAGATQLGTASIPNTGSWSNYTTVNETVTLPAGDINLGINAGTGGFNLNWFRVSAIANPTQNPSVTPTPSPTPSPTPTPTSSPIITPSPSPAAISNYFFDDFIYSSNTDSNLSAFGWLVRTWNGAPGPSGAGLYSANNVSFVSGPTNTILRLTGSISNGTASQAELNFKESKMLEGTYAARVYFNDTPDSGSDGAYINEAPFWTMSDYSATTGTNVYSELDFEYLPNGGWGANGPAMYMSTWYNDATSDASDSVLTESLAGWRTLVIQVSGGHVKYYVGSRLLADHSGKYYPRSKMQIIPQLWFVEANVNSTWHTDIDWCYYAQNTVLSAAQVEANIATLRATGKTRQNTVQ